MPQPPEYDFIVVGAGSAGCAVAAGLADAGSVAEAGIKGTEGHPGADTKDDAALRAYIRQSCGTAYHPVGTIGMGGETAPLTPRLAVKGLQNLWVADASVMPSITSANTNTPSMMIGHRAAQFITQDAA